MPSAITQTSDSIANFLKEADTLLKTDSRVNIDKQTRKIFTPAWVPDSYLRSRSKNLYLNMLNASAESSIGEHLDFYEEPKGGGSFMDKIKNALKSALGSAVTAVTNQVGAMANTAQGIANSLGIDTGKDDSANNNTKTMVDLVSQPLVRVYGFNFVPPVAQTLEIIKQAWETIKNISNSDDGFGEFFEKLKKAISSALDEFRSDDKNGTPLDSKDICFDQHGIAEAFILNSAQGTYKIEAAFPMTSNEMPFLSAERNDGSWTGGLTDTESMNSAINKAIASTGLNLGISPLINWTSGNLDRCTPLKSTFTLYNDTLHHLAMNFEFILGFFQTAMPTTGGMLIKSPFLYDVILPTGVKYYSCTCSFDIKCRGKLRKISMDAAAMLGNSIGNGGKVTCSPGTFANRLQSMSVMKTNNTISMEDSMLYFPDAYDVTITFTSLLPDTWNLIAGWLIDSTNASFPSVKGDGEDKKSVVTKMIQAFSQEFKKQPAQKT